MARNGYLAEDGIRLVTVEDNDQLIATAAAAFHTARAAAARDGYSLWIVEPAGAYRSYATQWGMYYHPEDYNLNPKNSLKGASPGYSTHGWGNRIDVNQAALTWMIANGHRYGWTREFGAADPNHFKHDGRTAISGAGSSSGGIILEPLKELDMRETQFYKIKGRDDWSRVGPYVLPVGIYPGGYEATTDVKVARLWGWQIAGEGSPSIELPKEDVVALQQWGHREYLAHRADDIARVREGSNGSSVSGPTAAEIAALVKVPTAAEIAALVQFPTTLTIDPPPATGTLS